MPIEIKEMHIKINVDEGPSGSPKGGKSDDKKSTKAIIETCIEGVMEILEQAKER